MTDEPNYDEPYMILSAGDAASLHLAIKVLLSIAKKHTPKGGGHIKISLCEKALKVFDDPKFVKAENHDR